MDNRAKLLSRPGWIKDGKTVCPQRIWPDTVRENRGQENTEKEKAISHNSAS